MRYIYAIVGGFLGILLCVGFGITDKNVAIHQILSMATLNGVSKDKIQRAFIWLWHQHFEMNDPVDLLTEDEE